MVSVLNDLDPWWSVIGLSLDLLGFAILALDLSRDYWRTQRANFYKRAAKAARHLIPTELPIDQVADGELVYKLRNPRDRYELFLVRWAWFRMRLADYRKYGRWFVPEPDFGEQANVFDSLADEAAEAKYRRAPLFIGIAFILLGFALQIVGAWPS